MLNIVFCSDDNYIKYLSVLIYSIVKNININNKINFHIISDFISKNNLNKISDFEQELNKIIQCKILIHKVKNNEFKNARAWGFENSKNHLTYLRFYIDEFINADVCLYLDVDMLVVSDISELFSLDLKDKFCACVLDSIYMPNHTISARNNKKDIKLNPNYHFNAGFLLLNLREWKKANIRKQALEFLKLYDPIFCDQDVLNIIFKDKIYLLPLEWNFVRFSLVQNATFKCECENYMIRYTRKQHEYALSNLKIIHYNTDIKPWKFSYDFEDNLVKSFHKKWWNYAFNTPIFQKELIELNMKLKNNLNTPPHNTKIKFYNRLFYKLNYIMIKISKSFFSLIK
ncbi:glycosyltransferase family 8 protein [Campylobacter sp.]|uniref:glycosyltransferase family 8 protein n=1 Tax=Campylobacter sp. TaxID=205 RepID=UPI0025B86F98|nr:glycosyltransferase family 8 protein [Campylobacter sp.]